MISVPILWANTSAERIYPLLYQASERVSEYNFVVTIGSTAAYTDGRSVMRYVLPQSGDRIGCPLPRVGAAGGQHFTILPADLADFTGADRGRPGFISALTGGEHMMKVVIWKSPKYLRGILCRLFHIA